MTDMRLSNLSQLSFVVLAAVLVIACFFKPQWFVEYEVIRIIILVGAGFLPMFQLIQSRKPESSEQ